MNDKFYRVNDKIKFSPVMLIDENGQNLGQMPLLRAKEMARIAGMDLVEVFASKIPPICKIMDYSKFKYEQDIKEKKQRQAKKNCQLKEIRLSCGIAENDINTKANAAIKFLKAGHKVQVKLGFKRREKNHTELGFGVIDNFCKKILDYGEITKKPKLEGVVLFCMIEPKK